MIKANSGVIRVTTLTWRILFSYDESMIKFVLISIHHQHSISRWVRTLGILWLLPLYDLKLMFAHAKAFGHLLRGNSLDSMVKLLLQTQIWSVLLATYWILLLLTSQNISSVHGRIGGKNRWRRFWVWGLFLYWKVWVFKVLWVLRGCLWRHLRLIK